jgi:hypothetical protein
MNNFNFEDEAEESILTKLLADDSFKALVASIAEKGLNIEEICEDAVSKADLSRLEDLFRSVLFKNTNKTKVKGFVVHRWLHSGIQPVGSSTEETKVVHMLCSAAKNSAQFTLTKHMKTETTCVLEGFIPVHQDRLANYLITSEKTKNISLLLTDLNSTDESGRLLCVFELDSDLTYSYYTFSRGVYKAYFNKNINCNKS